MYAKHILFSLLNISDDLPIGSYRGHLSKFLHCKKPLYCTFFKKLQKEILYTYIHTHTHTHTHIYPLCIYLLLFSCSVMPDSLQPCGPQHVRLHPTILSSVVPFSSCLRSMSVCLSIYISGSLSCTVETNRNCKTTVL